MKFTLSWLKDHLQTEASLDQITDKLTKIGLEVESVINPSEKLQAFTIARILEAKQHPDADKLKVCTVDIGQKTIQVVCGAANVRSNLLVVFAKPGTYIPGSSMTIGEATIRGVSSAGMLCSERELELSQNHHGIIELDARARDHVGQRYIDFIGGNDPIIEIAVTPNRPDCLGVRGIARDLAAAGLGQLIDATDGYKEKKTSAASTIAVELDFPSTDIAICPVFAGRLIKNVTVTSAPDWMTKRLNAVGIRLINAAVDITNYISLDLARPLHIYDANKVHGTIKARLGRQGESFVALNGNTYNVNETMCVIADDQNVLGLGGIMGGEASSVTDTTQSIFIESAYFNPVNIAATGRKTGINSDARYRFERGIDPQSVQYGLDRATQLILECCGGQESLSVVAGNVPDNRAHIAFDPAYVEKLTGAQLSTEEIIGFLTKLGFTIEGQILKLKVVAPSWRPDIHGAADLVEEVVRLAGPDRIPMTPLPRATGIAKPILTQQQKRLRTTKHALASRGMVEAVTWSFIPEHFAKHFGGGSSGLKLSNPISIEMSDMRPSLLPGLISAVRSNANRDHGDIALFEAGQIFLGPASGDQINVATGVRAGTANLLGRGRHWDKASTPVTVFDAKADAFALLHALSFDPAKAQLTRSAPAWFHPGRSGTLQLGAKTILGHFGELHPETLRLMDVDIPIVAFEIFIDRLPQSRKKGTSKDALNLNSLQPVRRDFAFLVDKNTEAGFLIKSAENADKTFISDVIVFDIFEGKGVPDGKKSIAIEVTLTPNDKTLTDAEIETISNKIVQNIIKLSGAELRK